MRYKFVLAVLSGIFCFSAQAQPKRPAGPGIIDLPTLEAQRVQLPNGWSLTPVGTSLPLGDLPLNIAVSRSGKYAAVTNNGPRGEGLLRRRERGVGRGRGRRWLS